MTRRGWLGTVLGGLVGAWFPQTRPPVRVAVFRNGETLLDVTLPGTLYIPDGYSYTFGFTGFTPGEDPMRGMPGRLVASRISRTWGESAE